MGSRGTFGREKITLAVVVIACLLVVIGLAVDHARTEPPAAHSDGSDDAGTNLYLGPDIDKYDVPRGSRVLFFGDSYTEGWGAEDLADGYAYQMSGLMGWDVTVRGVGGTGYLDKGSKNEGNYVTRIERLDAVGPYSLIVLQGGSNDQAALPRSESGVIDTTPLSISVEQAFNAMQAKYPNTPIIMLGPVSTGEKVNPDKQAVDATLSSFAYARGVHYISPIAGRWFLSSEREELIDERTGHPNGLGYEKMARMLKRQLNAYLVDPID
ncbi:SGNH/GDSL hydrolase family protein [Rhodococcus rhodochrous]|uniref:SGNH/GDSL hydrolase family protein n=1 Tax=Rhodococcus rhodochrous TaxID=1829 RepID=UPI001E41EF57|nr:SGNH/GDSL hydrolase family protein [Rhodococcus rhodochrous]MCD2100060.1 SGNH/GDSL hydrolase family protein [Rhodococcus rhodochrous]MCD2124484.1 SGNH/GDSL hydrolase family protein [Rhodococcus rhodochrous]MCQ4137391.1 SGNH/GDSL hydrolase family protein [Rhodococcus rhodochrous]MDJ0021239.1 SGNH/GDSL hydrolase family protein [Rhodococcus rhodochrous]